MAEHGRVPGAGRHKEGSDPHYSRWHWNSRVTLRSRTPPTPWRTITRPRTCSNYNWHRSLGGLRDQEVIAQPIFAEPGKACRSITASSSLHPCAMSSMHPPIS